MCVTYLQNNSESSSSSNGEKNKIESWQRSVGGLSSSKSLLGMLVKRKKPQPSSSNQQSDKTGKSKNKWNGTEETTKKVENPEKNKNESVPETDSKSSNVPESANATENKPEAVKPAQSALGLLGNYSDSDSNGSGSD